MAGQQRRLLNRLIVATALVVTIGVGVVGSYVMQQSAPTVVWVIGAAATALAFLMLLLAFAITRRLFDDIERLRGDILVAASGLRDLPPIWSAKPDQTDELILLTDAVIDFGAKADTRHTATKERLATVIACLDHPVLLITHSGIVSLHNMAAETLFGEKAMHLGASVFSLFDAAGLRDELQALEAGDGQQREAELALAASLDDTQPRHRVRLQSLRAGGFVLVMPGAVETAAGAPSKAPAKPKLAAEALSQLNQPASLDSITDDTPLTQLPVTVFDCETTGLNSLQDRMVSFGTIRMTGTRQYPLSAIDVVINPGRSIPSLATSIHGITDTLVAHAPRFEEVWPQLEPQLQNTVLVGHHIAFDVGFIERELAEAGLSWNAPKLLDTARLIRLLKGLHHDPSLDEAAAMYGLDLVGRHSALGDTLMTASLYGRLLEEFTAAGVHHFGSLRESLSAGRLIADAKIA